MSKPVWLKIVKDACKTTAFEDLLDTKLSYSKGENLQYGELKMRSYFQTKFNNKNQAIQILKLDPGC